MRRLGSLVVRVGRRGEGPGGQRARRRPRPLRAADDGGDRGAARRSRSTARRCLRIPDDPVTIVATGPLTSDAARRRRGGVRRPGAPALLRRGEPGRRGRLDRLRRRRSAPRATARAATTTSTARSTRRSTAPSTQALTGAECASVHDFEKELFFEGCLPVEVIASRGEDTLRFGPMKPVGLVDPRTGRRPYAVVQLRQDNLAASHWSIVGFQTQLKWGEQKRVFRMIPGLERAEFVRFGMIHRNTYVNAPLTLEPTFETRRRPGLFFAGQMSGVEGYVESAASGLARRARRRSFRARGEEPQRAARGHRPRRARPLHRPQRPRALPAHEHRLRPAARARRSACGTRRRSAWRSPERALASLDALPGRGATSRRPPGEGDCRTRRTATGTEAAPMQRSLDRGVPAPPRARAQRLAAHDARLRRGPRAVRRATSSASSAARRARRTSTTCWSAASSPSCTSAGSRKSSSARKLAGLRTLLPLPVPRGPARGEPGARARDAAPGEAHSRRARRGAGRGAARHARRRASAAVRGRAILELLYATGIRCAELVGARRRTRSTSARAWCASLGKGRKERIVLFGRRAQAGPARRGSRSAQRLEPEDGRPVPERARRPAQRPQRAHAGRARG